MPFIHLSLWLLIINFTKAKQMKIAIIGYGKMGKTIEALAKERGHSIAVIVEHDSVSSIKDLDKEDVDVAIEFTNPEVAFDNLSVLAQKQIPAVSGTTGWLDKYAHLCDIVNENKSGLLYASNFSVGVNIFFELNKILAKLMSPLESYNASMEEIHHIHKLDAPSGTAITLANDLIGLHSKKQKWENSQSTSSEVLGIESKRIDEVPGTHTINYHSDIDQITISHEAFSRQGFALGAILAAEWMVDKEGIYSMQDVLDIKNI